MSKFNLCNIITKLSIDDEEITYYPNYPISNNGLHDFSVTLKRVNYCKDNSIELTFEEKIRYESSYLHGSYDNKSYTLYAYHINYAKVDLDTIKDKEHIYVYARNLDYSEINETDFYGEDYKWDLEVETDGDADDVILSFNYNRMIKDIGLDSAMRNNALWFSADVHIDTDVNINV